MPIEPDTKDWTWVAGQRCPECGYDGSAVPSDAVAARLRTGARAWVEVLARRGAEVRPDDDTWSALEYGCHLRDAFGVIDRRLRSMLAEDDPLFPNWDQDATAIDEDYASESAPLVAEQLVAAADRLADRFDTVATGQWTRPGRRSDGAGFTVLSLGRYALHEPIHHLVDLSR